MRGGALWVRTKRLLEAVGSGMKTPEPEVGYPGQSCWSGRLSEAVKTRRAMDAAVVCQAEQEKETPLLKTPVACGHKSWRKRTAP